MPMKTHSATFLTEEALSPAPSKPKTLVRYIGFEVLQGHRRLNFSVKPFGIDPVAITVDIPDSAFTGRLRISIQDTVPMTYDKLVHLSNTQDGFEAQQLCLTDQDIAQ